MTQKLIKGASLIGVLTVLALVLTAMPLARADAQVAYSYPNSSYNFGSYFPLPINTVTPSPSWNSAFSFPTLFPYNYGLNRYFPLNNYYPINNNFGHYYPGMMYGDQGRYYPGGSMINNHDRDQNQNGHHDMNMNMNYPEGYGSYQSQH